MGLFTSTSVFERIGEDHTESWKIHANSFTTTGFDGIIPGYSHKSPIILVYFYPLKSLHHTLNLLGVKILEG
jgi:hypothetical protein